MKKILTTIALIMAFSLTAYAGHIKLAPPDGATSATTQYAAPPDCKGLFGHQD